MMQITLEIDSIIQTKVETAAHEAGMSLSEWIMNLIHETTQEKSPRELTIDHDPLRDGLFTGTTDLAETSEDILKREINLTPYSGWTWKKDHR